MDINGSPQPEGGRHPQVAFKPQHLAAPILPEPDASDVDDVGTTPVLPYLTPDAMLVYCQSRLSGIDSQCSAIMTRQEKNAHDQAALGELESSLDQCTECHDDKPEEKQSLEAAYNKAINAVGGDTPLGQQLSADRDQWLRAGGNDNIVSKEEMTSLLDATKSHKSQLNSDAEIDMIRLQSLMSQRQTAVQLTTNIVQSLNDQANKIVANIGH